MLVFPYQTGTSLTGASNAGGIGRNRNSEQIRLTAYLPLPVYRVADYFSAISVSICTKLARSILMRDRIIGTQPNFQQSLSKPRILSPKNSCLLVFFTVAAACSCVKLINTKCRHGNLSNRSRDTQI